MNSHLVKLSAIGLAGSLVFQANTLQVMAKQTLVADNNSVAGVSVDLDKIAKNTQDETSDNNEKTVVEVIGDAALSAVNNAIKEEDETKKDKTKEKDIRLNIKYDHLGIADVEESLNVRAKASTDSRVIAKMGKNAICNVEKITKDGWAKIQSGDVRGFVLAEYLIMDEEAEELARKVGKKIATVKTETLNVRFLPSTQSAKYTLIPGDEEMEVVEEHLTEKYVSNFISKHFNTKKTKAYISDVDLDAMKEELKDWICVSVDDEKVFVSKEFVTYSYEWKRAVSLETKEDSGTTGANGNSSGQSSVRLSMVSYAKQFLGNRYVYGGTSLTGGIDCSGFTMRIYQHFGYSIPRNSAAQAGATRTISSSEAKPGDLFFYGYGGSVSHVAMYIGGGQVIHASNERTGIKISNAFYRTPIKVGRVIND